MADDKKADKQVSTAQAVPEEVEVKYSYSEFCDTLTGSSRLTAAGMRKAWVSSKMTLGDWKIAFTEFGSRVS